MTVWVVRGGRGGEHEQKFLDDNAIYLTWGRYDPDLSRLSTRDELRESLRAHVAPGVKEGKLINHSGQHHAFVNRMRPGDMVLLPRKHKASIAVGEVEGPYEYDPAAQPGYYHKRRVKWIETDVPRTAFDRDLLSSINGAQTIFSVERNNAEARIRRMGRNGWVSTMSDVVAPSGPVTAASSPNVGVDDLAESVDNEHAIDLEREAADRISRLVLSQFKLHPMEELVAAVLEAQGFETLRSPHGPDGGIDILAAPAPLGFGSPRICVQVKSSQSPIEREVLDQLIGVMQKVNAEQGLLVSWGGFRSSIDKEAAREFFRVRLWDSEALLEQVYNYYDKLPEDIRSRIPLKQVWIPAISEAD